MSKKLTNIGWDLEEPSEELLQWAEKNINENPDTKCQILSDFKDLIFRCDDCIQPRTDDEFLLRFLRARHFNLEKAYELFANYYNFQETVYDDLFNSNKKISKFFHVLKANILMSPQVRDTNGRKMLFVKIQNWDLDLCSIHEILQTAVLVTNLGAMEPKTQIAGGIAIFDFQGFTVRHACQVTPRIAYILMEILMTANPVRIEAVHILNESVAFYMIYKLFTPFLSNSIKKRIFFHGNKLESLHRHIEPQLLPVCYGGSQDECSFDTWLNDLNSQPKIKKEVRLMGYDFTEVDINKL